MTKHFILEIDNSPDRIKFLLFVHLSIISLNNLNI